MYDRLLARGGGDRRMPGGRPHLLQSFHFRWGLPADQTALPLSRPPRTT
jgi:hypothetical protein